LRKVFLVQRGNEVGLAMFRAAADVIGAANPITNPVWQASNNASANYPVAYVQGQTISLTVTPSAFQNTWSQFSTRDSGPGVEFRIS
jgi:hypothetical protein